MISPPKIELNLFEIVNPKNKSKITENHAVFLRFVWVFFGRFFLVKVAHLEFTFIWNFSFDISFIFSVSLAHRVCACISKSFVSVSTSSSKKGSDFSVNLMCLLAYICIPIEHSHVQTYVYSQCVYSTVLGIFYNQSLCFVLRTLLMRRNECYFNMNCVYLT